MGLHEVIVDTLMVPFVTSVLGVDVTVESVDSGEGTASWPSAPGAGSARRSGLRIFRCRNRRLLARSGSTPIVTGWAEPDGNGQERSFADGAGLG